MRSVLADILQQRYLLWSFVNQDLKTRYGGSAVGFIWSVVNPLLLIVIYTLIFSYVLEVKLGVGAGTGNYGIFLFCGMLPWIAINEAITKSSTVILTSRDLVKQVNFPTMMLPLYVVISALLHELIAMVLFVFVLLVEGSPPSVFILGMITILPLQVLLTMGICLVVSSLNVYYKDVAQLVYAALTIWFFATPIVFPLEVVPDWMQKYFLLNPLTHLVNVYRAVLLGAGTPDVKAFCYFILWAIGLFGFGVNFFNKTSKDFADLL
ncbi:MAG: ABC transporter permease [Candidatus Alcyoniella australis]|nr:ABC transporter permease [Candidatus Alcyoniella australis]